MYRLFSKNKKRLTTLREQSESKGSASASLRRGGFTLPEMLISLSIVAIISSVVLSNQHTYTEGASLSNLAEDISLSISQAQIYGVSVRQTAPDSSDFNSAYGVEFRLSGAGGADDSYVFFVDLDDDREYEDDWSCPVDDSSECLEKTAISNGNTIDSLCVIHTDDSEDCNIGRLAVTFIRPNTTANLKFFNSSGSQISPSNVKGAKIKLSSLSDLERSVSVYKTGYISVQ